METNDHRILGKYLLDSLRIKTSTLNKKSFLLGSIIPDKIPFTYLRGSIDYRQFRGHDYYCAAKLIRKYVSILSEKQGHWNSYDYFRFGLLMHYVADAFTFPHNDEFDGDSREHAEYEALLHTRIRSDLLTPEHTVKRRKHITAGTDHKSIIRFIRKLHDEYLGAKRSFTNDIHYIKEITLSVARAVYFKPVEVSVEHKYRVL